MLDKIKPTDLSALAAITAIGGSRYMELVDQKGLDYGLKTTWMHREYVQDIGLTSLLGDTLTPAQQARLEFAIGYYAWRSDCLSEGVDDALAYGLLLLVADALASYIAHGPNLQLCAKLYHSISTPPSIPSTASRQALQGLRGRALGNWLTARTQWAVEYWEGPKIGSPKIDSLVRDAAQWAGNLWRLELVNSNMALFSPDNAPDASELLDEHIEAKADLWLDIEPWGTWFKANLSQIKKLSHVLK